MRPLPPSFPKRRPKANKREYRAEARASRIGVRAAEQSQDLRAAVVADSSAAKRPLMVAFDGGYTHQTVLKRIPPNPIAIGRLRKDTHLLLAPDLATQKARGPRFCYGSQAPTPQQVGMSRHGVSHELRFKRRTGLMCRRRRPPGSATDQLAAPRGLMDGRPTACRHATTIGS
jgi:hypothetical protein